MGRLARTGILGGKRVPSSGLISSDVTRRFDPFSRRVFESAGYLEIAQRILHEEPLSLDQIEELLSRAPLAILMKLAELRVGQPPEVSPRPIVLLPLQGWLTLQNAEEALEAASHFLEGISHDELLMVIDSLEVTGGGVDQNSLQILNSLAKCRKGLKIVGPSVEEIVSKLVANEKSTTSVLPSGSLVSVLSELARSGVTLLRTSGKPALLRHALRAGFPISVKSNIDEFVSNRSLAKHFQYLNELSGSEKTIDFWMPTLSEESPLVPGTPTADVKLLRALAVSAVAMLNVERRRASSRYFSLNGFYFSRFMGANEFGVGAVNAATSKSLSVPVFERLHEGHVQLFNGGSAQQSMLLNSPAHLTLNY